MNIGANAAIKRNSIQIFSQFARHQDLSPYADTKWPIFQHRFGQEGSFAGSLGGYGNDGQGTSYLDTQVPFGGAPTMRIVNDSGKSIAGTNPGQIPNATNGNVTKRRLQTVTRVGGRFYVSQWVYLTFSQGSNCAYIMHLYNRTGSNRIGGAVWLDIVTPGATVITTSNVWNNVLSYNWQDSGVSFNTNWSSTTGPGGGGIAGNWHYLSMGLDFTNTKYLYLQVNEKIIDLSSTSLYTNADASPPVLHFSNELISIGSENLLRYANIADVEGGMIAPT